MGVETQQYIRKPLYVEAVRVTQENFDELVAWCQGEVLTGELGGKQKKYIKVRVHHPTKNPRQTQAYVGDWLLYTEFGGYKVYTNKAFQATFELVEEQTPELPAAEAVLDEPEPSLYRPKEEGGLAEPLKPASEETIARFNEERAAEEFGNTGLGTEPISVPEPIEEVPATPANIAQAVNEQEQARAAEEQADPIPEQSPEVAAAGKRVLSQAEQNQMGPDAVRELVQSGEVILEQDLAA
jgi:hypothetical protein